MAGQVRYRVTVTREGRWWVGEVEGLVGGATEVTRLADLDVEVRDLIGGLLDVDDDSFDLDYDLSAIVGNEGQAMWEAFASERAHVYEARRKLEADRLAALRALADAGVSVRDSAALVGLSHQRVSQLLNA